MLKLNKIYNMDCMVGMKEIPDNSIDLIAIDSPYNIKIAEWDKWEKQEDYINWMGGIFKECQRVLKDSGSFYWFHNDMMQIKDLMVWLENNSDFVFKQFIVWNKKFKGCSNNGYLQGFIEPDMLRNYQKMAEYCLFYTFQDDTGLTAVKLDINNFSTLRRYFKDYQEALGLNKKQIMGKIGQSADHPFRWNSSQWDMPTKKTYNELSKLPLKYEFVRKEYEDLRKEYEDLRYTFNNQKTHHSVWNYEIAKRTGHITPKPVDMIENIIKHSSNAGDTVLDCFMGSGTTAIACIKNNRNFIGFEINKEYCELANARIDMECRQIKLWEI